MHHVAGPKLSWRNVSPGRRLLAASGIKSSFSGKYNGLGSQNSSHRLSTGVQRHPGSAPNLITLNNLLCAVWIYLVNFGAEMYLCRGVH